jgi:transposase
MEQERIAMTQEERDRLHWLKQARDKKISQKKAAENMGVCARWIRILLKRHKREGDGVVVHGLRGQASNHKMPEKKRRQIMAIVQREYADFGPTLACEYLAQKHHLEVSKETLRKWMIEAGLRRAERAKVEKVHGWRARRACCGELVQWDTSEHDWLEGRGPKLYLIAMIDDATSTVYGRFARHDSTEENLRTLWGYLERYGRPQDFYTDKASLFVTSPRKNDPEEAEKAPTAIGRALRQLGMGWIPAHSPQAKGRIERFFGTAQDRLVRGLRKAKANTLEQANEYLQQHYLRMWNERFVQPAKNPADAHRPVDRQQDLAAILCRIEQRVVANDYTFGVRGQRYQIDVSGAVAGLRKNQVQIQFRLDGSIKVAFQDRVLEARRCQPEDAVIEAPELRKSGAVSHSKPHLPKRGSNWFRNFDLHSGPELRTVLKNERRAGRI